MRAAADARKRPLQLYLIALVLLAVVPIAAASSVVFVVFAIQEKRAAEEGLIEITRAMATATEFRLEGGIQQLRALAGSSELALGQLAGFERQARQLVGSGDFLGILLADANGRVRMATGNVHLTNNGSVENEEYFRQAHASSRPYISDVVTLPFSREKGVVLAFPVLRNGQLVFMLLGIPDANRQLMQVFSVHQLPPQLIGTIMDRTGTYVARSLNPETSLGLKASEGYRAQALKAREGIVKNTNPEGMTIYGTFVHTSFGWITALGQRAAEIEAPYRRLLLTMGALWLGSIALGIFAAILVARRISRSLSQLSETATEVGAGTVPAAYPESIREVDAVQSHLIRAAEQRNELLREHMRTSAAAEASNRAKDEFLAMLGHELRNPIGTISNAIAAMNLASKVDHPNGAMREVIQRQVAHLSTLVDDLLDTSRLVTGKVSIECQPMSLTATVRRCIEAQSARAADLRTTIDLQEDVWIEADETRIEQIVGNLLANAIKYTPAGGTVTVRLRQEAGRAVLTVADTGIGIAPELLPHVFDLFVQGSQGLERARGGLGIGLTLVKRLVALHGGKVEAHSEGAGRGSAFTVFLPSIARPAQPTGGQEATTTRSPSDARGRVLIIEDQADQREALRLALTLHGYTVLTAADGATGIALAESERPDTVLIDIGLPEMDGYEVARRLRDSQSRHAVLIALTGYGQPQDRARAEAVGFDLYLIKPVDDRELDFLLRKGGT